MKELTSEKTMTISEVAEIFNVTPEAIKKWVRELYPETIRNGKMTHLNEEQVTGIKLKMRPTTFVVANKTDLEKKLLIRQAVALLEEEIFELRLENEKANNQIKMLVHDFNKTYTATEIAKELNLKSAQQLNNILQEKKVQYRQNGT